MAVKVSDILLIPQLRSARILAGENGLHKVVRRIASIEKPFVDHPEYCYRVANPCDIYISKLYVFADHMDKFSKEIEFQRDTQGSGLITHKEMISYIDETAIAAANSYAIPIIAIDDNIGLTELIFAVMDLILQDKAIANNVLKFQHLLQNDLSESEIKHFIASLDQEMGNQVQALYMKLAGTLPKLLFDLPDMDFLLPIYDGYLYIATDDDENRLHERRRAFLSKVANSYHEYHMGISGILCAPLGIKDAILQAMGAFVYASHLDLTTVEHDSLDPFFLLSELRHSPSLRNYKERLDKAIWQFDKDNKLSLNRVLELFIITGGNYRLMSEKLFIHETTVRYRMNKLKKHLNYTDYNNFYCDMRLYVHSSWILDDPLLSKIK